VLAETKFVHNHFNEPNSIERSNYFRFDVLELRRLSSFFCAASNSSSEGSEAALPPPYLDTKDENIESN
jgi:hypothetical protein